MKKRDISKLTPKDLSLEELVRLKVRIKRNIEKKLLSKRTEADAEILLVMIDEELEERGFGKENELKQSISTPKPRTDERTD